MQMWTLRLFLVLTAVALVRLLLDLRSGMFMLRSCNLRDFSHSPRQVYARESPRDQRPAAANDLVMGTNSIVSPAPTS